MLRAEAQSSLLRLPTQNSEQAPMVPTDVPTGRLVRCGHRRNFNGGPGIRTPMGLRPAVFKTAALPVRTSPPESRGSRQLIARPRAGVIYYAAGDAATVCYPHAARKIVRDLPVGRKDADGAAEVVRASMAMAVRAMEDRESTTRVPIFGARSIAGPWSLQLTGCGCRRPRMVIRRSGGPWIDQGRFCRSRAVKRRRPGRLGWACRCLPRSPRARRLRRRDRVRAEGRRARARPRADRGVRRPWTGGGWR
jgi:hypothetical protein